MSKKSRKDLFLNSITLCSIDLPDNDLAKRSKFNFSYFTVQPAGQDFSDWSAEKLCKLLSKLKDYSLQPLDHWERMPIGKTGNVLSVYGKFPAKSDFTHPKHVPHQALWARFRLEKAVRLIGFVIPKDKHQQMHKCGEQFDCNTFYIVFLDENHSFYKC